MAKILPEGWELPEALRARVGASVGRQRAMLHGGHALLLLHQAPRAGERERRGTILWRKPDGTWLGVPGASGPGALRAHLDAYQTRIDQLEQRLAIAKTPRERFELMRDTRPFARAVRNLHAALQEVRTAIPADREVLVARDRAYDMEREASGLLEEAGAAVQLGIAEDAEEQAAASTRIAVESHRLNLLAAVCLPITALGAMLGMNVETGLEHIHERGLFFAIVGGGFTIGFLLNAWVRRPIATTIPQPAEPRPAPPRKPARA